ncbi:hypothetical protein HYW76_03000 [Candidatus Pacearchaeota archaeon]|nr:hypothetical protein [Candidatus Pacearchaeota archaeon]
MKTYKGCIVEESLEDNRILNGIKIFKMEITKERNARDRWHIYHALVNEKDIEKLMKHLKQKWYMHFWNGNKMIVCFKERRFELKINDKRTWQEAVDYGLSLGIPIKQLDFSTEF